MLGRLEQFCHDKRAGVVVYRCPRGLWHVFLNWDGPHELSHAYSSESALALAIEHALRNTGVEEADLHPEDEVVAHALEHALGELERDVARERA